MIASSVAPWWYTVLAGLALLGYVSLVTRVFIELLAKFFGWVARPLKPTYHQSLNVYMEGEHKDPTRPRAWEDEMQARVVVAERMRALEKSK
jgi:hypothetical protein